MTVCVETVESILEDPEKSVTFGAAFDAAFPPGQGPDPDDLRAHFTARFRYRMIGSLNFGRWLNVLKDRILTVRDRSLMQWDILETNKGNYSDLSAGSFETSEILNREEMPFSVASSPGGKQYLKGRDGRTVSGKTYSDLNTSTAKQAVRDVADWWEMYLSQFDELFLERV